MNIKIRKLLKFIYVILVLFIIMNMYMQTSVFAIGNFQGPKTALGATILKGFVVASQIAVSGFFIIKFTLTGIQYFTAAAASDKAENRNKLKWTLLYGVLAYLLMFLFARVVGL